MALRPCESPTHFRQKQNLTHSGAFVERLHVLKRQRRLRGDDWRRAPTLSRHHQS
jgi:hypothetical protein